MGLFSAIEARLGEEFGYGEAVLFGRARSALVALLEVLALRDSQILIPSNVCPALLVATWGMGSGTSLLPVEAASGLVSDSVLTEAIERGPGGVAIATQLYGYRQPYPRSRARAKERGWFFLENDTLMTSAHSVTGRWSSDADALLVSFGYAKTVEAGGGGALLTNDWALANELRLRAAQYPLLNDAAERAEAEQMRLRRASRTGGLGISAETLLDAGRRELRYRFPERLAPSLNDGLANLACIAGRRRERALAWAKRLSAIDQMIAPPGEPIIPWRVVRRIPQHRDTVVSALRTANIDAGTNYPPLVDTHPNLLGQFKNGGSTAWGNEVINLWVSDDYGNQRIDQAVDIILSTLSALHVER